MRGRKQEVRLLLLIGPFSVIGYQTLGLGQRQHSAPELQSGSDLDIVFARQT